MVADCISAADVLRKDMAADGVGEALEQAPGAGALAAGIWRDIGLGGLQDWQGSQTGAARDL